MTLIPQKLNTHTQKNPWQDWWLDVPTKRTVLRRKELKLQPPALMLLSDLGHVFSLDCMQYMRPSPIIIYRGRHKSRFKVRNKHTRTHKKKAFEYSRRFCHIGRQRGKNTKREEEENGLLNCYWCQISVIMIYSEREGECMQGAIE